MRARGITAGCGSAGKHKPTGNPLPRRLRRVPAPARPRAGRVYPGLMRAYNIRIPASHFYTQVAIYLGFIPDLIHRVYAAYNTKGLFGFYVLYVRILFIIYMPEPPAYRPNIWHWVYGA